VGSGPTEGPRGSDGDGSLEILGKAAASADSGENRCPIVINAQNRSTLCSGHVFFRCPNTIDSGQLIRQHVAGQPAHQIASRPPISLSASRAELSAPRSVPCSPALSAWAWSRQPGAASIASAWPRDHYPGTASKSDHRLTDRVWPIGAPRQSWTTERTRQPARGFATDTRA